MGGKKSQNGKKKPLFCCCFVLKIHWKSPKSGYRVAQVLAKLVLLLHLIQTKKLFEEIGEKLHNMLVSKLCFGVNWPMMQEN
jgi:hypothetical protein